MTRLLLISILNLALPFLLRAAWLLWRQRQLKKRQPQIIDVTPQWHFPVVKLLAIGVLLLAITLIGLRLWQTEPDTHWHSASPAVSREY